MNFLTPVVLLAIAVVVLALNLLTASVDGPNSETWNVIAALVAGAAGGFVLADAVRRRP